MLLCDDCKKRPAKVHITKIINNSKTKLNLCEECARDYQKQHSLGFSLEPSFSLHKFLAGLLDEDFDAGQGVSFAQPQQATCEKCGLTAEEFVKSGRLGCSMCYETFRRRLEPLLARIHGNTKHTGKVPECAEENIRYRKTLDNLRRELQIQVSEEKYEEAAVTRDKIRELESKIQGLS